MDAAQAVLKKAPPADLGKNLQGLGQILSKDAGRSGTNAATTTADDALLSMYILPLQIWEEVVSKDKPFIMCKYNRVGERHRSPWSNKLYPGVGGEAFCAHDVIEDEELHLLEAKINSIWEAYKNLYYGHESVGSVYLQDRGDEKAKGAFLGFFGVHKTCSAGTWNSIHIVHVDEPSEKTCNYRVESSVLMVMTPTDGQTTTNVDLSATVSKETSKSCKVSPSHMTASHIENIGTLIETVEIELRSSMERVHVPKTQDIMNDIQKIEPKMPVKVNPLMGMIMGSDMLKKKHASG